MLMEKKLVAEFIGTYFLVFAGTGAVVIDSLTGSIGHIGVSLTFGLVVMVMIYTFGHVSGAHFNPAVTVGFWANRSIHGSEALLYILSQMTAALVASFSLRMMFGTMSNLGATLPRYSWGQSFLLEVILTFGLMMVIFGSAVHGKAIRAFAGIAIGGTVALAAMFAGPISGASMNPARSFGPAVASGVWDYLWIYFVATVIGALLAAWVYRYLHEEQESV